MKYSVLYNPCAANNKGEEQAKRLETGFVVGGAHRKKVAEAAIGSATEEAARIVNNAMTEAEQKKKETIAFESVI